MTSWRWKEPERPRSSLKMMRVPLCPCDPALLTHISPLGWAHILLTSEYRWRRQVGAKL